MDSKKQVKDFITYICDWVESEYKDKGYDGFEHHLNDVKLSYLVADKGIDKRIQKQLFERLNLQSKVAYELSALDGTLRVRLIKAEYIPQIQFPKESLGRLQN